MKTARRTSLSFSFSRRNRMESPSTKKPATWVGDGPFLIVWLTSCDALPRAPWLP